MGQKHPGRDDLVWISRVTQSEAQVTAYVFIQIDFSFFHQFHVACGSKNLGDRCNPETAFGGYGQVPVFVPGTEETVAHHITVYFLAVLVHDDRQTRYFFPVIADHVCQGGVQFPGCRFG